ncbi:hypothetical protein BD560DRAFT_412373 [Blakeslea trispora]|nr:hypothetical protein BD560DRAFT_412373 [Blakeslea trispora]
MIVSQTNLVCQNKSNFISHSAMLGMSTNIIIIIGSNETLVLSSNSEVDPDNFYQKVSQSLVYIVIVFSIELLNTIYKSSLANS